ncbi:hypothetical protein [Rossellomorea aquimaris]|uniref:hypothetical protein n=1 Tax=Rossellomorea aquimaris TaxID=189382 RepID=UPI0009EF61E0|nr:hypothetical protein [Rossellomorea aquimaris]
MFKKASFLLLLLPFLPIATWLLKSDTPIDILIVDKTVPQADYREHGGLVWLLNYLKIQHPESDKQYLQTDYAGYHPEKNDENKIQPLTKDNLDVPLIYLADTYGVYPDQQADDERGNEPLYGGLTNEEVTLIQNQLFNQPTTLVTEFNTLASPTSKKARVEMEKLLGVEWTGWIGRYFHELNPAKNDEIPEWLISNYGSPWSFNGSGVVFSHANGDIVVLEEEKHISEDFVWIEFTKKGESQFGLDKSPSYQYWFDIVQPTNADSLASYQIDLTDEGENLLAEHSIPSTFPAVTHHMTGKSEVYYFAGDYVDIDDTPAFYHYSGMDSIRRWLSYERKGHAPFFWKTYIPMMKKIIENIENDDIASSDDPKKPTEPYYSKIKDDQFQVLQKGKWENLTIKGVNIGMGKPGYFPGETAITKEEYLRWFTQISEMNANTIRVYTLHPPAFYQALKEFNEAHTDNPLYVLHGIWIEEEPLEKNLDAFHKESTEPFKEEMKRMVDVIHGNANVEKKAGHASGLYSADISQYVAGWIIGIEWYPYMVENTNKLHHDIGDYKGTLIYTKDAKPFEHWLGSMMDTILTYDYEHYKTLRPISFTNWVTTDLLDHPFEPLEQEDLVGIDPNTIYVNEKMEPGQFASYHVYPYYPDFLYLEPELAQYKDKNGERNSYAGYLNQLHQAHRMPILIAEFGVPSSRGKAHDNSYGWNQGALSEKEQGVIDSILYKNIIDEGLLGGLVFSWQDEWFKRTWNTKDLDDPERRPYWSNSQTNEQHFGLLSFDRQKIKIDGEINDWSDVDSFYSNDSTFKDIQVTHDERYLYLQFSLKESFDWEDTDIFGYFDTASFTGNDTFQAMPIMEGTDFVLHINGKENSALYVDRYYDPFYYEYGEKLKFLPQEKKHGIKNSGFFNPIRLALSKPMTLPLTGEKLPFHYYETGKLTYGIGNPEEKAYNSLSDFYVNDKTGNIEVRIPWLLLNYRDPSQHVIMDDLWKKGLEGAVDSKGITMSFSFGKGMNNQELDTTPQQLYEWDKWDLPPSKERLKQSYYILQDLFHQFE